MAEIPSAYGDENHRNNQKTSSRPHKEFHSSYLRSNHRLPKRRPKTRFRKVDDLFRLSDPADSGNRSSIWDFEDGYRCYQPKL